MKKRQLFLIALLVNIGFIANAQTALKVGDRFPGFALQNTTGTIYDLNAQKKAKGFILVFMTPTCEHCIMYEDRIMALDKKYKPKGFPVVAVGPYGDDPVAFPLDAMPEMKKLAAKKAFTFPYVSDEKFKYTWLLGIKNTPTAVILLKQPVGYLIKYIGKIDDEENPKEVAKNKFVENQLQKLL